MKSPTCEEELIRFLYMLPLLRAYVSGVAGLATKMKSAVTLESMPVNVKGFLALLVAAVLTGTI